MPFILGELGANANTIVIGHSSGAEAALRLAEQQRLAGVVLVCACHTDLGEASEREAGYYSRPWLWEDMKSNTPWILQYHSTDDPFIPVAEARYVPAAKGCLCVNCRKAGDTVLACAFRTLFIERRGIQY